MSRTDESQRSRGSPPGRRSASLWTNPPRVNGDAHHPPPPVTRRIPVLHRCWSGSDRRAHPNASKTGEVGEDRPVCVRKGAPDRGERCSAGVAPWAAGLEKLRNTFIFTLSPPVLFLSDSDKNQEPGQSPSSCLDHQNSSRFDGRSWFRSDTMWKPGSRLLLLLWLLSASGELQQETEPRRLPPPGKLDFGYVPSGVYETLAHYEPGPIGILFHTVHAFLYAVQPNAFPHGKRPHPVSRWL